MPTVTAADRNDLAFGTGFVHGQDRFFQMDLARRLAAGELSELAGGAALGEDRLTRLFRFRHIAQRALAAATPAQRALLTAYAQGVNAGLASLRSRPWEYWLLRTRPAPWRPEDSFLVVYAMWWQLQSEDLDRERLRREVDERLGGPRCASGWKCALEFLYPARTVWDAPSVADEAALQAQDARGAVEVPVPGPEALDLRGAEHASPASEPALPGGESRDRDTRERKARDRAAQASVPRFADIGSNAWAVAGRLTATGAAVVASDMHLSISVPPTWYRARLRLSGRDERSGRDELDLNGLTLPGAPALVAGSNGHVAWAFTNSDGKWLDVQPLTCLSLDGSALRTPDATLAVSTAVERIHVRGAADDILPVISVGAGPSASPGLLLDVDAAAHRCWIARWLAEEPSATNMNLLEVERATSVEEVLALAPTLGIPAQNIVVGDAAGHIGWAIAGRIPLRAPTQDLAPTWLSGAGAPRLYDPPIGRIWTANARATDDPAALLAIGGNDASVGAQYVLGSRARQIRDALLRLDRPATALDMLPIQLDDRAVFLARWRGLLLRLLDDEAVAGHPLRKQMRELLASWDARAGVDSVGYRLVRAFHDRTESAVWSRVLRGLGIAPDDSGVADSRADVMDLPAARAPPLQFEQPLWTLISQQPRHLLSAEFRDWHEFLLDELDETAEQLASSCGGLAHCRWGAAHPVLIRHPLSRALPILARLIDLPPLELPGDHDMPRVQDGAFGASERFAVSPGHEDRGYLHLPGGQSDHPLSPYYQGGFRAWAEGRPLPFLPGPSEHRLTLQPSSGALH